MNNKNNWHFDTLAIHGNFHYDVATGAVIPPIHLSSTFAQTSPGVPISHYEYSRTANPTRDLLESYLATLELGKFGLCFASGCAALATLLQLLKTGDQVILSDDVYGGTLRLFEKVFLEKGISFTQCDMTNVQELLPQLSPKTALIWIETPSNPLLKIMDIEAVAHLKKKYAKESILAIDNTFATPYLQNPLQQGADIVCHSTTKYIGGHSDVVGGALILNNEKLTQKLRFLQNSLGAIPSPTDCYLLVRSIKTLGIRMRAHCENAKIIANYLQAHPLVEKIYYPGLSTHPQHAIAKKQMRDFGAMISMVLKANENQTRQFLKNLQIFTLAESLGGVESLIEQPALMTHAAIPLNHRKKIGIEDSLVRLSIGIEDPNDLIDDLDQAFNHLR